MGFNQLVMIDTVCKETTEMAAPGVKRGKYLFQLPRLYRKSEERVRENLEGFKENG